MSALVGLRAPRRPRRPTFRAQRRSSFLGERSALSKALILVAACVVAHALALAAALDSAAR